MGTAFETGMESTPVSNVRAGIDRCLIPRTRFPFLFYIPVLNMSRYIQIEFSDLTQAACDILMAQLVQAGFEGFEEEGNRLRAFVNEAGYDEEALLEIAGSATAFTKIIIEETNWNQVWESNFSPVIVDEFAAIRADFHEPVAGVKHEIIITPKMSFGTGHHATTYLMMQQLQKLNVPGKTLFDFGTGTGVLAILAEKMGAAKVLAIDNDQWSYTNATENITRNNCTKIELLLANAPLPAQQFDIILANINKNIITDHLETLAQQIRPGGCLIISGILVADETDILTEIAKYHLTLENRSEKDNWLALKLAP